MARKVLIELARAVFVGAFVLGGLALTGADVDIMAVGCSAAFGGTFGRGLAQVLCGE